MTGGELAYLTPEAKARVEIDRMLAASGWAVQDARAVNLSAARGVAVREFVLKSPHGRADYLLFVDGAAAGVVEAKKEGETLTGVEWQSTKYVDGLPDEIPTAIEGALPFAYESTGTETRFTNTLDPDPASREVFSFHRPETLAGWLADIANHPLAPTLRHRLRAMPPFGEQGLWAAQVTAIRNLERSLADNRPRALIQMATGSGKTFTAANVTYRLVKHADARRVLFLVDRANLGRQTLKEFQSFSTPDDGRKFTELYNVQHLSSNHIDPVSRVTISTIQRVYSILRGETTMDEELDEHSAFELTSGLLPVEYDPKLPPEFFDVVIVDECHRSIYGVWRQVLDYFDAFTIGLTATPNKQAFGFFNQNLVMEYGHEQAVVDGVNVDFDVYRIKTEITERGSTIDAGLWTRFRERQTRRSRWELLEDDLPYTPAELDKKVVARDQIRTVLETFRDRLFTEIFPGRSDVPKTLIFAKDDAHAEEIVQIARDVFGKGNDFVAKITYKATGRKTDDLIASFRTSANPRIAVTVDMIATGTDVKPLECVFFMRSVKSRTYFEQMKGRGVRVISDTDLQAVVPGATSKERFVIVDAVGVTETELQESPPLDRQPTAPLERLLKQVSFGVRDPDTISTIASRLARLDRRLSDLQRTQLTVLAGGTTLREIAGGIVGALDPDRQLAHAKELAGGVEPSVDEITAVGRMLLDEAVAPLAQNPELRQRIVEVRRAFEQAIDETSADRMLEAGYSADATDRARATVDSWERFCEEHRDEITALELLYTRPYTRRLTFREVKELAKAIERPPHRWTPDRLWEAYEALDRSKVRGSGQRVLTDLVSLVRVALHQEDELVPYPELVRERYRAWLLSQENARRVFTAEQHAWLERIRDHVAASLGISTEDFDYTPFREAGGLGKAAQVFGDDLGPLLEELNEVLVT
ncbi:type I restriction-modification enzyme R subunit C-terminal domain-containing protein [soil metagenome]